MECFDIVIIGGGPAGLAAADSARESGCESILILERDVELGGILNQCIHNGFGLHTFKEELTGPEYANRYLQKILEKKIEYRLQTMVMDITPEKIITAMNRDRGLYTIQAKAIVLAMGCRERARGALNIPGYRPAGIFSAGTAQRLVNIEGYLPGKEVVILGSGDIGLIMARRMTLEGANVKVVAELLPFSGGLKRNIVQCLDDFGIPLKLKTTVIDIDGKERLKGVTLAQVGEDGKPILSTKEYIPCDTLLLSVGLIPENELSNAMGVRMERATSGPQVSESMETSIPGVFACGNVLHVHDLVDFVSQEAAHAGKNAAKYVARTTCGENTEELRNLNLAESRNDQERNDKERNDQEITIEAIEGVRYTVPKTIHPEVMDETVVIRFRVSDVFRNSFVSMYFDQERVLHRKKTVMAPGEMEEVVIKRTLLEKYPALKEITFKIEKE